MGPHTIPVHSRLRFVPRRSSVPGLVSAAGAFGLLATSGYLARSIHTWGAESGPVRLNLRIFAETSAIQRQNVVAPSFTLPVGSATPPRTSTGRPAMNTFVQLTPLAPAPHISSP